ncbi:MAG: hypothetical protein C0503_06420 [Gemmatimonas sp.]|nr:hypothetical protein [Gemmatimonas sp.]
MRVRSVRFIVLLSVLSVSTLAGAAKPDRRAPIGSALLPAAVQSPDTLGRTLYRTNCRACHGVLGAPTRLSLSKYRRIPNLTDPAFWAGRSADSVVAVLRRGVGEDMESFAGKLTPDEMRAVAVYARSLARSP